MRTRLFKPVLMAIVDRIVMLAKAIDDEKLRNKIMKKQMKYIV